MDKDYYAVLGTGREASAKEIRQAYRRLARQYHPDVNPGDKAAEAKFKEINEAHEVLSDPEKRKKYDQFGENWRHAGQFYPGGAAAQGPFARNFGSGPSGRGGTGFEDLLGEFLGGRGSGRTATGSRRRVQLEQEVEVSLEEALRGTTRVLQIVDGPRGGSRRLEVKIPPGVDSGSRVRVRADGTSPGEELYLVVSVTPDDRFERRGDDLYAAVEVPLVDAVLGGEVEVSTLTEKVALKIPPETQNGRSFRLSGKGMPRLGSPETRGSLYVKIQVRIPSPLTGRERELFQELKTLQGQRKE
ncbi:MAG: hypothetical protein HW388_995 [Dehalococcoidia bacterium]|nr:hypothetical protein [Dehalococcoidia bacterium]